MTNNNPSNQTANPPRLVKGAGDNLRYMNIILDAHYCVAKGSFYYMICCHSSFSSAHGDGDGGTICQHKHHKTVLTC